MVFVFRAYTNIDLIFDPWALEMLGADLANVCRDAAMEPMRRKLNSTGFNFENINEHAQEIEAPLKMDDFMTAIAKNQRTVSRELLKEYEDWMAEFGAS